jgi:RNA polymerase sigma-70 factor (ECF subfamily)
MYLLSFSRTKGHIYSGSSIRNKYLQGRFMDELAAIELLKKGDLNGLKTLVEMYYTQAVRSSYLILQDADLAEDTVQSTFLSLSQKIYQLHSDRFGPWFLKSVINASIKEAKRQSRLVHLDFQEDEFTKDVKDWLLDREPLPEKAIETEELHQQVRKALCMLSPTQRGVIVSKYYLEMSEKEISLSLNAPISSIKWWLHSARQKLKQFLTRHDDSLTSR